MSRAGVLSILMVLLAAGAAYARTPAAMGKSAPQITFEDSAVVASGLTPGRPVAWFGVEHSIDSEYSGEIWPHTTVVTAAADGTARLDLARPLMARSMWAVVDLDSGGYALAAPEGYRIAWMEVPPSLIRGGTQPDEIFDQRSYVLGLAVRAGVGAWTFTGGDGGDRDVDGESDGSLSFAMDRFDALSGSPAAPAQVGETDLWLVIDPMTMEIAVLRGGVAQ